MGKENMIYRLAANAAQKSINELNNMRDEIVVDHFEEVLDDEEFMDAIREVNSHLNLAFGLRNACIDRIGDDPERPYEFIGEDEENSVEVPALVITVPLYDEDPRLPLDDRQINMIITQVREGGLLNRFNICHTEVHKMWVPK